MQKKENAKVTHLVKLCLVSNHEEPDPLPNLRAQETSISPSSYLSSNVSEYKIENVELDMDLHPDVQGLQARGHRTGQKRLTTVKQETIEKREGVGQR
ncbi:hypothetical protein MMC07_006828 [Pseudocyphellaria aurata]|nr:hypothetical protein [Pseudocyphellaria aurata]